MVLQGGNAVQTRYLQVTQAAAYVPVRLIYAFFGRGRIRPISNPAMRAG